MEQNNPTIGDIIKKKLSISDLADAFGISRPTLYRYIEYYETGRKESIPDPISMYFDYISAEDVDGTDARMKLISMRKKGDSQEDSDFKVLFKKSYSSKFYRYMKSNVWNNGDIRTLPITRDERTMVVYEGGYDPRYTLTLFIKVSEDLIPIGEYKHGESKGFFVIDDVVACDGLFYEVSFYDGIDRRTSGRHPLGGDLI